MISYTAFENQINIYEERMCMYIYIEIMYRESKTFPESESHFYRVHLLHQEPTVIRVFIFVFVTWAHELQYCLTLICNFFISGLLKTLLNVA